MWRHNGIIIVATETEEITLITQEVAIAEPESSTHDIMQAALLRELIEAKVRRDAFLMKPESDDELKKRMGWY